MPRTQTRVSPQAPRTRFSLMAVRSSKKPIANLEMAAGHSTIPMSSFLLLLSPSSSSPHDGYQLYQSLIPASYLYLSMVGLGLASVFGAANFWKKKKAKEEEKQKREAQIEELKKSLKEKQEEVESKEAEGALLRLKIEEMRKEVLELKKQVENVVGEKNVLVNRVHLIGSENQVLASERKGLETRLSQALELLETRTNELKGAQMFLTKADALSGAEVIKKLEALNAEILQTAALMAESFRFEKKVGQEEAVEGDEIREAYAGANDILGPRMVELLRTTEHHDDPILVQIAFQAGMAAYTHWIISSWYFEDPEDEHLISEIYARVRESEEQAISGRWRSLTRTHLQRMLAHEPDLSIFMVDAFVHVLITAGIRESAAVLHERVMRDFRDRIALILRAAIRLNKSVGEGITSCDLEAFYVAPDVSYNAATMEDTFGTPRVQEKESAEQILCTTDLGLVRAERKPGKEADWLESVLLKPKVVLSSGLQDVIAGDAALLS